MEEEVRDAVFGNVGTTVVFRMGPFDAEVLETIFMPQFTQTDLVNLGFAQIYLTLMIDGVGSPPFSATTIAPFDDPPQIFTTQVIENSRKQYGVPRTKVEEDIKKWHELDAPPPPVPKIRKETTPAPARESFAPPPTLHHPTPEMRHAEAKTVAENVAHKHAIASSKAGPENHHQQQQKPERPHDERPKNPPLEGATSLRDALASVTARQAPAAVHAPDLKQTIANVAPKAAAQPSRPAHIPEAELKQMLAVEEGEDEKNTS
ncbi:MAG: hypothetical protein U1C66_00970 [Patescibacteria group bacterium]|nr:hypothetical protein [Patescibacteria group bacterium]